MARRAVAGVKGRHPLLAAALLTAVSLPGAAQTPNTPTPSTPVEIQARDPAALYAPSWLDRDVTIRGVVNARAFHIPGYNLLAIQDEHGGAVLRVADSDNRLDRFSPGDEIEADGRVAMMYGMAVVILARMEFLGHRQEPVPAEVPVHELMGFRNLGRLVTTEGRVKEIGENSGGQFFNISTAEGKYRIFLPRAQRTGDTVPPVNTDDKIRVTGVAFQYCTRPPYNTSFELLVGDPTAIVRVERSWLVPPWAVITAFGVVLCIIFLLWTRERRLKAQRERLRKTYHAAEEVLSASSAESMAERLNQSLPGILGISRVRLYTYNRTGKTLDLVACDDEPAASISLSAPPGGIRAGAVACFHYRTLLVIPDIEKSPFPIGAPTAANTPKSVLFVPMMAQGEVAGVLEIDQDERMRDFSSDEQELAQHLGNQVGVAVRLLDQRSVQEQLFRTEKLAAVGRLISGVVNELQVPLASISDLANHALERVHSGPAERDVAAIAAESRKAAGMVARLVSFAGTEPVEARPVSISTLLCNLIEFREGDWKASGIRIRDLIAREPLFVLGSHGQLEQVFLNLLVHAEQSLAEAAQKVITIRTAILGKRLLVEIAFTGMSPSRKAEETAAVLGVTRSVVAGHGGEVRLIEKSNTEPRFEVELPSLSRERVAPAVVAAVDGRAVDPSRRLTALVIDPEEAAQRQMLGLLSSRSYRVVPVGNSDTGLELAQRMRFEVAFCSIHAPGLNWVELSERMHGRVGAFVLVSDAYDADLSADFEEEGRFVLSKPIQETELDRVLQRVDPPVPARRHGAA